MTKQLFLFFLSIPLLIFSQNKATIHWINNHAIPIEDALPDTELHIFDQKKPSKFTEAKIYGFGEASHNTKEFFDLKTKFFKYLVKNHGVKTFIMEESYQAEAGINEWINGGEGDSKTIANHFRIGFWYCKEIVNLLQWMRDYNKDQPESERIRFFGMDTKNGDNLNQEIRTYLQTNKITVNPELLSVVDSCSNKKINFNKPDYWWALQTPKLKQLEQQLLNSNKEITNLNAIIRSLKYLIHYTEYGSSVTEKYPKSNEVRDLKMFENVKWIVENESKNGKAFIWAHNEHINKSEMYYIGSGIMNLGRHLKDYYQDDYYSVGFDFGRGKINGFVTDSKNGNHWKTYTIEKPFKNTYAHSLMEVDKNIYFIDLENAIQNEPSPFFKKESKHLLIAAGGYLPKQKYKIMISKIYAKSYDGLIFVKEITIPNYQLD